MVALPPLPRPPLGGELLLPRPASGGRPEEDLEALDGVWIETSAGSSGDIPTCTIIDAQVSWNQKLFWGHAGTSLRRTASGQLAMDVGGKAYTATFSAGSPACLVWSDGAIWLRDELQGVWVMDEDGSPAGIVQDGRLQWDAASLDRPPAALRPIPALPSSTISLVPSPPGEKNQATFSPGPPARLAWSNGTTWRRTRLTTAGDMSTTANLEHDLG